MENNILLDFQNVSFSYDEETSPAVYAVKDMTFTVKRGEFVAMLGHNGSGKSTVAKLANGLLLPTAGKVLVDGMDTSAPENELNVRKKVGLVFQNPDNQIVASIVEEDVAFGPENLSLPREELRERVDEALRAVGMYDRRFSETYRLSGGQKQRVAIAGIIAMRPACIVLDEPTAMLDPKGRASVLKTVRRLNKEQGLAVVLITHFMEEALDADRVFVAHNGSLAAEGTPGEIFSRRDLLTVCGLELPDTAKLCGALQALGVDIPSDLLTEDAFVEQIIKMKNG